MPVVGPPDQIGRLTVLATDRDHLTVSDRFVEVVRVDDNPIADLGMHASSFRARYARFALHLAQLHSIVR
jgi:hypothetical protein